MAVIHLLSQNTIDQIAAGEVVERPRSVVKELTENAIDARATAISVEIKEGGISLIRVTDNGSGIEKSEIRKAFLRHATSKIEDAQDLPHIQSLGSVSYTHLETVDKVKAVCHYIGTINVQALLVGLACMAVLILWPMLTKVLKGKAAKIVGSIPCLLYTS